MSEQNAAAAPAPAPSPATAPPPSNGGANGSGAADGAYSMQQSGVPEKVARDAAGWLSSKTLQDAATLGTEVRHKFDVSAFNFAEHEAPYLTAFANAMYAKGYTQQDFEAAVRWYKSRPHVAQADAARYRLEEQAGREHATEIWNEVRAIGGQAEFEVNRKAIVSYLRRLSPAERTAADALPMADLIARAKGGTPAASLSSEAREKEIAEIEKLMVEDRAAYNRDESKQSRLRDLYRARG
jgi:hypothetical protein